MAVKISTNIIKCLLKMDALDLILEKSNSSQIAVLFDEIYAKILDFKFNLKYVKSNFNLNYNNSKLILKSFIESKSNIKFEDVYSLLYKADYRDFGVNWVKYRKSDPPFEIWPQTPNKPLQEAYIGYVSTELPKEYTEKRYYDYMIKNGAKRSSNCTAIYTLFSNNNEHKIIFINDNNILIPPAKKRMTIPIEYEEIKTFIGEELDTNNITMLTKISGADFDKICGGNHLIDCFVYSDIKNIYRERTPLKQILEYFANVLELKFDVKIAYE